MPYTSPSIMNSLERTFPRSVCWVSEEPKRNPKHLDHSWFFIEEIYTSATQCWWSHVERYILELKEDSLRLGGSVCISSGGPRRHLWIRGEWRSRWRGRLRKRLQSRDWISNSPSKGEIHSGSLFRRSFGEWWWKWFPSILLQRQGTLD